MPCPHDRGAYQALQCAIARHGPAGHALPGLATHAPVVAVPCRAMPDQYEPALAGSATHAPVVALPCRAMPDQYEPALAGSATHCQG